MNYKKLSQPFSRKRVFAKCWSVIQGGIYRDSSFRKGILICCFHPNTKPPSASWHERNKSGQPGTRFFEQLVKWSRLTNEIVLGAISTPRRDMILNHALFCHGGRF